MIAIAVLFCCLDEHRAICTLIFVLILHENGNFCNGCRKIPNECLNLKIKRMHGNERKHER